MINSKGWDWSKNKSDYWLIPAVEASFLAESWDAKGFNRFLDLGCGLGRHSIYFGKKGFQTSSVDISEYGIGYLEKWAEEEGLEVKTEVCDMLNLPFEKEFFDCIIAYNVIYHTDTEGFIKSLNEISRVLKSGGELFVTLISKGTWSYRRADNYKRIDENTILRYEHDTEKDVPHFYVDIEDIKRYFIDFEFVLPPIEQAVYDLQNSEQFSKHFNLLLRKR